MSDFQHDVQSIINHLQKGKVVLFPSDTIWQLGCDPFNKNVVERLYQIKNTDLNQKMILLVKDGEMLEQYADKIHPRIHALNDYHKRPVTVIYTDPINLPNYLLAQNGSVAIRIVKDEFCQSIINHFGKPILVTSANLNGAPSPDNFAMIPPPILKQVDYTCLYRQQEDGKQLQSIIVELTEKEEFEFLRL